MKEQNQHVKTVLEQAHELARLEDKKEKVPYEDVEKALNEKLASIRIEENDIERMCHVRNLILLQMIKYLLFPSSVFPKKYSTNRLDQI